MGLKTQKYVCECVHACVCFYSKVITAVVANTFEGKSATPAFPAARPPRCPRRRVSQKYSRASRSRGTCPIFRSLRGPSSVSVGCPHPQVVSESLGPASLHEGWPGESGLAVCILSRVLYCRKTRPPVKLVQVLPQTGTHSLRQLKITMR